MQKAYAQALVSLSSREGADATALTENLIRHLARTGRTKLLPRILREVRILEAKRDKLGVHIEVAHEAGSHAALKEAAEHGINATKAHVNSDLIGGWRARKNSVLVDNSAKQGLIDLYRKITTQ